MKNIKQLTKAIACVILLYTSSAMVTYRFKHPEMTETELILQVWDAITLK